MTALPCQGRTDLYDAVLFPDGQPDPAARAEASALCGGCPAPCDQMVTASTAPLAVALLAEDWLPPAREGHAAPEVPTFGGRRKRQPHLPGIGHDYVRPAQRPAAWARMAAGMASEGRAMPAIADALCVDEATATLLVQQGRVAA